MYRVMIVDDDVPFRTHLTRFLKRHAFLPIPAKNARHGAALAHEHAPNLILLKWQGSLGLAALRRLRREFVTSAVPIIAMAAPTDSPEDEIWALDAGVDFFFTKDELMPHDAAHRRILLRHIHALILRGIRSHASGRVYQVADLRLNAANSDLTIGNKRVHLAPKELGLLEFLLHRPNTVFPAKVLWRQVWAMRRPDHWAHTLSVTISSLRRKLGPKWSRRIVNAKTQGYRLRLNES
jgi:DNA-binding response OmpR family regulator